MDAFGVGFLLVLLALAAALLCWWLYQCKRADKARLWPITEATVESSYLEVVARIKGSKIELPVFVFTYQIDGGYYSGRFALLPYITSPGMSILESMIGRKLRLCVKPGSPEVWFIPDGLIEGCKIKQKLAPRFLGYVSSYYPD